MSGVFQNIDPPPPHRPEGVQPPPPPAASGAGGGHIRWVERGWGVNSLEDARHCSVRYSKVQTNQFSKITSSAGIICTSGKV
jgi:hypothetical protein